MRRRRDRSESELDNLPKSIQFCIFMSKRGYFKAMGSSKFKEYKGLDLPAVNSEVLERWTVNRSRQKRLDPRRASDVRVLRGTSLGQRHAGYPPCDGPHDQGRRLPLQDPAGLSGPSQSRMGYARTARRAGRREEARHHEGGYRDENTISRSTTASAAGR